MSVLIRVLRRVRSSLFPWLTRERVRLAAFRWLDLSWRRPSGVRLRVSNFSEWDIYNEVFVDGEYDAAIDRAIAMHAAATPADAPLRVLDLGANVGFFTLRVIDRLRTATAATAASATTPTTATTATTTPSDSCRVTLVEANPDLLPELQRRLHADNALGDRVSIVHGLAGGEASGTGVLYPVHASPGDSSIVPRPYADRRGLVVSWVDLDMLMADATAIDLLKCDIEGAELRLLERYPALLRKTRVAVFELHAQLCDVSACRRLLAEAGLTHVIGERRREAYALYAVAREPAGGGVR